MLSLHAAADGALARVRLPGGRCSPEQLQAVAEVASSLGSGLVDLTSRANLQIRGLPDDPAAVAAPLAAAGLLPSVDHERARNVLASPFAGTRADRVVERLDAAICASPALTALPGRFVFVVDDGSGGVDVDDADVALLLDSGQVVVDGVEAADEVLKKKHFVQIAIDVAEAFVALADGAWRVRELPERAATLGLHGPRVSRAFVPVAPDGETTALVPLRRLTVEQLLGLAALGEARFSVSGTVTVPDAAAGALAALGFVLEPGSGWEGLSACAGLGHCAQAQYDVRAFAAQRATLPGRSGREHWAACERCCGRPRGEALVFTEAPA